MGLKVNNISKKYGLQYAVKDINFELQKGEVVGFLGPNGAGKSTTMKIIVGAIEATAGSVLLNDVPVNQRSYKLKKNMGFLSEKNPLYEDMFVLEYLRFNAEIYNVSKKNILQIVKDLDLQEVIRKKINQLSKGYHQRVGLAAAILHDPELLILDEPTSGLDPNQLVSVRSLIKKLATNKMVLFSSHIMQEVLAICDRVILINQGHIIANRTIEELKNEGKKSIEVEFDREIEETLLESMPNIVNVKKLLTNSWLLSFDTTEDKRSSVFDFASSHQLKILKMDQKNKSLEEVFQSFTMN